MYYMGILLCNYEKNGQTLSEIGLKISEKHHRLVSNKLNYPELKYKNERTSDRTELMRID